MTVSVLVPYQPDDEYRDRAWAFNRARWEAMDVELVIGEGQGVAGSFQQSRAINAAARRATGDVFVIADADVALEPAWVTDAVELVRCGVPWVLPRRYRQLTERSTLTVLTGDPLDPIPPNLPAVWVGDGISWTGGIVLLREAFEAVGGYEERFGGWGANDICFAMALDTLWGQHRRLEGDATHLWHARTGLDAQGSASATLMRRYIEAHRDVPAMRELLGERA